MESASVLAMAAMKLSHLRHCVKIAIDQPQYWNTIHNGKLLNCHLNII